MYDDEEDLRSKINVYESYIYSSYIDLILPSTENTKAVANKVQTGPAGTFETLNFRKSELIS